ncbi:MAG: hypothetical protein HY873_05315 [Chloroflexi bacterium]|nr:hypothetical protein [Chloroflexota bacterium]
MRTRFLRVLAVVAVVQFVITRQAAGRAIEEGRAERLWMLYPLNVVLNAAAWTLMLSAGAGALRLLRRGP